MGLAGINIERCGLLLGCILLMAVCPVFAKPTVVKQSLPIALETIIKQIQDKEQISVEHNQALETIEDDQSFTFKITGDETLTTIVFNYRRLPSIHKHIHLEHLGNQVKFSLQLRFPLKMSDVQSIQVGQQQWLVYSSATDIFIYKPAMTVDGKFALKEWIYALKPNCNQGSCYQWHLMPDLWEWPITLEGNTTEGVGIFRNMPVNGVSFSDKARRAHVARSVGVIAKKWNAYFPFHEKIAEIMPVDYWTKEGVKLRGSTAVSDYNQGFIYGALKAPNTQKSPDWSFMLNNRQNIFNVFVSARESDYPLLIDPSLVIDDKGLDS